MNKFLFDQRPIPTPFACAVARKSPVGDIVREVHVLVTRKRSMRWPVGKSHTRIMESIEAAIIHRPSPEKVKSLICPAQPQSSRITFLVSTSTTRIERSSQLNATRSLVLLYRRAVMAVIGYQSSSLRSEPDLKSQNWGSVGTQSATNGD